MTETSRSVMGRSCVARVALLSMLAVGALLAIPASLAAASEWVAASSYEDPEGKWVNETKAYDLNTSSYAEDRSNRLGWGAVLKLNYATPVTSDRVRVSTDFGYNVVNKLKLKVTYADDTSETREFDGTVVQNVTFSTLTFTKGSVKSVELSYNYLATGWYWWLYELQLYQCPPDPDPLAGQTLDPSSVNATSAVLHGQVTSSGGAPCYGRFKYWADGGEAQYTAWRSDLGTGQEFTAAVTGLTENQGYSYQTQLSPNAEPTPEQIVACEPLKTFTAVKVTEQTGPEWVSPSLASSEGGVWVNPACAMDDDEGTSAQWYHDVGADVWSPFISLATDLQSNGIRLKADGTNTDLVDIDIKRDGEWFHLYEGIFTGGVWQEFPFEKGAVTEARVRLRCSASYLGCFLKLIEADFHQGEELRPTRYFVGPGADWNSAANWSASSGGTGGASVPGTGCVAIFDANSPSCTLSANIAVEVLRLDPGFTGSLDAGGSSIVIERNRGFGELRVAGGELKLGSGTHTVRDNFRYLAGTVTPGTSTVQLYAPNDGVYSVDGDFELANVKVCHSGTGSSHKRVAVSGQLSVAGQLTLDGYESGGWHTYLEGSGSILAKGDIVGNGKVLRGTANLTVCGTADQVQTNLVWGTSGTYTVDKPSGIFYWAGTVKFGDATTSANSNVKIVLETPVDATTNTPSVWFCGYGEGDVTLTGPLTVYDLTFYRPGGTGNTVFDLRGETVTVENDLTIDCVGGGGWKVKATGGTLSCRKDILAVNVTETYFEGITLKLTGVTAQTVDLQGLKVLSFLNENTGGVLTLVSGLTAVDTIGLPAGSSVVFGAGATFTTNKVAFLGTVANPVTLRSSVDGTAWKLNVATRYQCPECVDVKDSDASGGQTITAIESIDQGNNTNWAFYARVDLGITSPAASVTSPAWVQGQCGPNITELKVKVNGGEEFNAVRTAMMRWYADSASSPMGIPLSASAATQVEVTGRDIVGNSQTLSQNITWTATDLAGLTPANVVRIRKGDSLLLTATDSSGIGTTLEIDGDGDGVYEHSGATDASFAHLYDTAGTYVAKAKVDGVEVGSVTVVVISIDLKGPIACQVGYQRVKSILVSPAAEAANVVFTGEFSSTDPNYELQVSVKELTAEGANLYIKALKRGTPIVYARLGADGPVIAKQEVDEFTLDVPAHYATLINDSTGIGQSVVVMRPYIPQLRQYFHMFGSQSTFGGGVTSFYAYTSTDYQQVWDPTTEEMVGKFFYTIEMPPGEDNYCFTLNTEQASSPWVPISTEGTVNGNGPRVRGYNSLVFMKSVSDETGPADETSEKWQAKPPTTFEVLVEEGAAAAGPELKYAVTFRAESATSDLNDTPQETAAFITNAQEIDPPAYIRQAISDYAVYKGDRSVGMTPPAVYGTKYGVYAKDILVGTDGRNCGPSGFLAVARLDANGPNLSRTTDPFPSGAPVLRKRSGVLVAGTTVVGEPVIIVKDGGEHVMTSFPDTPWGDKGNLEFSFYGVVGNNTNKWRFEAKGDGFSADLHGRKWFLNDVEQAGADATYTTASLEPGRYVVRLEYRDKATSEVIAKAEIHSLVVEASNAHNVSGKPQDLQNTIGVPFELRGKCDSSGQVVPRLDASVFVRAPSSAIRGRVSLDGYPQNEYWGDWDDHWDLPQVVSVEHNAPITLYLQGYGDPSTLSTDNLSLRVEGQALKETKNAVPCGESGPLTLGERYVDWYWIEADRETFRNVPASIEFTDCDKVLGVKSIPIFSPSPVVEITTQFPAPWADNNPSVVVTGTITTFIAPIEADHVFINGTQAANVSLTGSGPDGLGPFTHTFTSANVPVGNDDFSIAVVAVNAARNFGYDSVDIRVDRGDDGRITGRTVVARPSVPAAKTAEETTQWLDQYRFSLTVQHSANHAAKVNSLLVTLDTEEEATRNVEVLRQEQSPLYKSRPLFLVPDNTELPTSTPEAVVQTRFRARFGKLPIAKYGETVKDKAVPVGIRLVRNDNDVLQTTAVEYLQSAVAWDVDSNNPDAGAVEVTYRIEAGVVGDAGGAVIQAEARSYDAFMASVAPPDPQRHYAPRELTVSAGNAVNLAREGDEKDSGDYNYYRSVGAAGSYPLAFMRTAMPLDPDSGDIQDNAELSELYALYRGFVRITTPALSGPEDIEPVSGLQTMAASPADANGDQDLHPPMRPAAFIPIFDPSPVVLITSPANGAIGAATANQQIDGEVVSFTGPIAQASVTVNGVPVTTYNLDPNNSPTGPWRATFSHVVAIDLQMQHQTVVVVAIDKQRNMGRDSVDFDAVGGGRDAGTGAPVAVTNRNAVNGPTLPNTDAVANLIDNSTVTLKEAMVFMRNRQFRIEGNPLLRGALPFMISATHIRISRQTDEAGTVAAGSNVDLPLGVPGGGDTTPAGGGFATGRFVLLHESPVGVGAEAGQGQARGHFGQFLRSEVNGVNALRAETASPEGVLLFEFTAAPNVLTADVVIPGHQADVGANPNAIAIMPRVAVSGFDPANGTGRGHISTELRSLTYSGAELAQPNFAAVNAGGANPESRQILRDDLHAPAGAAERAQFENFALVEQALTLQRVSNDPRHPAFNLYHYRQNASDDEEVITPVSTGTYPGAARTAVDISNTDDPGCDRGLHYVQTGGWLRFECDQVRDEMSFEPVYGAFISSLTTSLVDAPGFGPPGPELADNFDPDRDFCVQVRERPICRIEIVAPPTAPADNFMLRVERTAVDNGTDLVPAPGVATPAEPATGYQVVAYLDVGNAAAHQFQGTLQRTGAYRFPPVNATFDNLVQTGTADATHAPTCPDDVPQGVSQQTLEGLNLPNVALPRLLGGAARRVLPPGRYFIRPVMLSPDGGGRYVIGNALSVTVPQVKVLNFAADRNAGGTAEFESDLTEHFALATGARAAALRTAVIRQITRLVREDYGIGTGGAGADERPIYNADSINVRVFVQTDTLPVGTAGVAVANVVRRADGLAFDYWIDDGNGTFGVGDTLILDDNGNLAAGTASDGPVANVLRRADGAAFDYWIDNDNSGTVTDGDIVIFDANKEVFTPGIDQYVQRVDIGGMRTGPGDLGATASNTVLNHLLEAEPNALRGVMRGIFPRAFLNTWDAVNSVFDHFTGTAGETVSDVLSRADPTGGRDYWIDVDTPGVYGGPGSLDVVLVDANGNLPVGAIGVAEPNFQRAVFPATGDYWIDVPGGGRVANRYDAGDTPVVVVNGPPRERTPYGSLPVDVPANLINALEAGVAVVPAFGAPPAREQRAMNAFVAFCRLVANTITHELGHSLGVMPIDAEVGPAAGSYIGTFGIPAARAASFAIGDDGGHNAQRPGQGAGTHARYAGIAAPVNVDDLSLAPPTGQNFIMDSGNDRDVSERVEHASSRVVTVPAATLEPEGDWTRQRPAPALVDGRNAPYLNSILPYEP